MPLFKNKNPVVRLEVCRLLTVFGTARSVDALANATTDLDEDVAAAAGVALEKIRERGE